MSNNDYNYDHFKVRFSDEFNRRAKMPEKLLKYKRHRQKATSYSNFLYHCLTITGIALLHIAPFLGVFLLTLSIPTLIYRQAKAYINNKQDKQDIRIKIHKDFPPFSPSPRHETNTHQQALTLLHNSICLLPPPIAKLLEAHHGLQITTRIPHTPNDGKYLTAAVYTQDLKEIKINPATKTKRHPDSDYNMLQHIALHEIGHALDHCLHFPSLSTSFNQAYKRDLAHLKEQQGYDSKKAWENKEPQAQLQDYFTIHPEETFAELFAEKMAPQDIEYKSYDLGQAMPNCNEWMDLFFETIDVNPQDRIKNARQHCKIIAAHHH